MKTEYGYDIETIQKHGMERFKDHKIEWMTPKHESGSFVALFARHGTYIDLMHVSVGNGFVMVAGDCGELVLDCPGRHGMDLLLSHSKLTDRLGSKISTDMDAWVFDADGALKGVKSDLADALAYEEEVDEEDVESLRDALELIQEEYYCRSLTNDSYHEIMSDACIDDPRSHKVVAPYAVSILCGLQAFMVAYHSIKD